MLFAVFFECVHRSALGSKSTPAITAVINYKPSFPAVIFNDKFAIFCNRDHQSYSLSGGAVAGFDRYKLRGKNRTRNRKDGVAYIFFMCQG